MSHVVAAAAAAAAGHLAAVALRHAHSGDLVACNTVAVDPLGSRGLIVVKTK